MGPSRKMAMATSPEKGDSKAPPNSAAQNQIDVPRQNMRGKTEYGWVNLYTNKNREKGGEESDVVDERQRCAWLCLAFWLLKFENFITQSNKFALLEVEKIN